MRKSIDVATVAEAYLRLLGERGIDFFFANAGTDFAPIIEAFVKSASAGARVPKPVTVPHENVAIAMALGHTLVSGRPQAVMLHVSVGTANAVMGILNAARAHVPVLFTAGRTPLTESGMEGSRNIHIHWTQEMFDQAAMVREACKWEYELRNEAQIETVVDRALGLAQSDPKGPVYLTLPREVLATRLSSFAFEVPGRHGVATPAAPDPGAVEEVATLLRRAERPLIITTRLGLSPDLAELAERFAVPVVQYAPQRVSLPDSHPMHAGYDPHPLLAEADLVIVLDSTVPWIPEQGRPRAGATVVHVAADPLHGEVPIRGFECDLAITASSASFLRALSAAPAGDVSARRKRLAAAKQEREAAQRALVEKVRCLSPIHPVWLTHSLGEALDADAIIMREAPQFAMPHIELGGGRECFNGGAAGGLGWGLGAAIGAKLAAPDRQVVAVEGDGAYMFSVPVAAHYVAMEQDAPFLTVILNNQRWNEVRRATRHLYPDGHAARSNEQDPLTYFDKSLRLAKTIETVGGHGEQVTDPAALPDALRSALRIVKEERRQAVLDVVCSS